MYANNRYLPWQYDEEFVGMLKHVTGFSVIDPLRLFTLWQFAKHGKLISSGSVAEVGVYKGGSLFFLSRVFDKETDIYGFDTFEGMPDQLHESDCHKKGDFSATSVGEVRDLIGRGYENVKLIRGLFPATSDAVGKKKFSFVHIDCDIYKSVMDCCEFFYERMTRSGIMLFDDYGFGTCKGAKLAVDEFFATKNETVIFLTTGQAVVIKK